MHCTSKKNENMSASTFECFMLNNDMLSLKKVCLNLIVEEFERFYFAFTESKDGILQKKFEFLQRRYSVELATALFESKKLEDRFFDFLINEHLNYLDGIWLTNSCFLSAIEDIFHRLPNLRRICFNECDDEILKNIAKFCPKIFEIDVSYSNVTDAGVKYLCESENGLLPCPELKNLFLMPSCITDKGVECLIRSLPLLERIDYSNIPVLLYRIHEENVSEMRDICYFNFIELTVLEFNHPIGYTNILKACLTLCPKLESLECYITDREQLKLFVNNNLKKVCLRLVTDLKVDVLDDFLKMNGSSLTSISVSYCVICVNSLASYCPVLKEFSASYVKFTCDDESQLTLPALTECNFEMLDPSSCKVISLLIASSPKLESISFTNYPHPLPLELKTQVLSWCKTPSAKKIQFFAVKLEMEFLTDIVLNSPSLEVMRLSRCFVYNNGQKNFLQTLAKNLPNKPTINFH